MRFADDCNIDVTSCDWKREDLIAPEARSLIELLDLIPLAIP